MIRKAILTIVFILFFLLFILYSGSNLFMINDGFKQVMLSKIRAVAGEQVTIDDIRLGFGSVNLQGLSIGFDDAPYKVEIDELQLGYSIGSLIKGSPSPEKTTDEVTVFRPRLTLLYDPGTSDPRDIDLSLILSSEAEKVYRSIIKKYDYIKRITISEGEIAFQNTVSQEQLRLAKRVNGWAYTDDNGGAWLRLAGNLFNTDIYNLVLYGQLDLKRGGVDYINIDLHDYEPGDEASFFLPDYYDLLSGNVAGHFTITERVEPTRGFDIEGSLQIKDGAVKVSPEHLYLEEINLEAEIKDWNLEIQNASQRVNGSLTHISGTIKNIIDPEFDLQLSSERFDVEPFLDQFLPEKKLPFRGLTAAHVSVTDKFSNPRIEGLLTSDSLMFYNKMFSDLNIEFGLDDANLRFTTITGNLDQARFDGEGSIDFSVPERPVDFSLELKGDFTNDLLNLGFTSTDSCFGESRVKVFGSVVDPVSSGEYNLRFVRDGEESLLLDGSFTYSQSSLLLTALAPDDFHLNVSIDDIFAQRHYSVEATNFQRLFAFLNDSKLGFLRDRYNLNISADGPVADLRVKVDGFRRSNYEKVVQLTTRSSVRNGDGNLQGSVVLLPNTDQRADGSFAVDWTPSSLRLSDLEIGEWLTGSFDMSGSGARPNGKFSVSGMSLALLLTVLGKETTQIYSGDIYGQVILNNGSDLPLYAGNLWLLDGFVGDVGPLRGELDFEFLSSKVKISKFSLQGPAGLNIVSEGEYHPADEVVSLTAAATGLKVEDVLEVAADKPDIVSGDAIIQIRASGKLPNVPLFGNVFVHNAKILQFNFDEIELDFGDEENANGSYLSPTGLNVGHAVVRKGNEYSLAGQTYLPFKDVPTFNLDLSGEGNFLAVLPDLAEIFGDSQSAGELDLHLAGQYKKPDFTGSAFRFSDGELQLSSVARQIDDLQGDLAVVEDGYFLDIRHLSGTIRGESFTISNTNQLDSLNHGVYEDLQIAGDDVNLGALFIQTSDDGVPLNIPGVMEGGDLGYYSFDGYTAGEEFFVAGPWRRPYVRGKIRLRNANVMFPFDEKAGPPNPIVMNIIDNINWDVTTVSTKDTRFVRQFPAGVYVNMEVDKNGSQLHFRGSFKDSTFAIGGKVESTRGEIEYLDLNFRVQKVGAEFIGSSLYPIVYGKAWTVIRDSTNIPSDVYMTLFTVDDVTHQEVSSGRWDRINIKLTSEYPGFDEAQGDVMATLGYSSETIDDQARKAVGTSTDKFLFRPIMRPLERQLERSLQLDVVRFSYAIARNFLDSQFTNEPLGSSLAFLRSSRLVLGKYLPGDVYVLYTGEIKTGIDYQFQNKGVGLQHILGLEYRLNSKWLLQMEYDYNTLLETHKDDKKVWLRHSFPF